MEDSFVLTQEIGGHQGANTVCLGGTETERLPCPKATGGNADISLQHWQDIKKSFFCGQPGLRINMEEKKLLTVGTSNVKNIETNEVYLRELLKTYDILAIQQHWLFFLSIYTGSLILEHYTRECEFGNFDKIKKTKTTQKKNNTKNTKTFG